MSGICWRADENLLGGHRAEIRALIRRGDSSNLGIHRYLRDTDHAHVYLLSSCSPLSLSSVGLLLTLFTRYTSRPLGRLYPNGGWMTPTGRFQFYVSTESNYIKYVDRCAREMERLKSSRLPSNLEHGYQLSVSIRGKFRGFGISMCVHAYISHGCYLCAAKYHSRHHSNHPLLSLSLYPRLIETRG